MVRLILYVSLSLINVQLLTIQRKTTFVNTPVKINKNYWTNITAYGILNNR